MGGTTWVEQFDINWKEWAEDFYLEISMDNGNWTEVAQRKGNIEDMTVLDVFFMCRYIRLRMTFASQTRPSYSMAGNQYIYSIVEVKIYLDKDRARLHPGDSTIYWDAPKGNMVDGNELTYWSTNMNEQVFIAGADRSIELGLSKQYEDVDYLRVVWQRPAPKEFRIEYATFEEYMRGMDNSKKKIL